MWHYPYRLNHSYCIVGHRTTAVNTITGVAFSRVKLNWVWTGRFTLISRKEPCRTIAKAETSLANGSRIIISLIFAKVIADIIVVLGVIPFFLRRSAQLETAFVEWKLFPKIIREVNIWSTRVFNRLEVLLRWITWKRWKKKKMKSTFTSWKTNIDWCLNSNQY